jgi:hypothetical protein
LCGFYGQQPFDNEEESALEPMDFWVALTAGPPRALKCLPDAKNPEPPSSLPNQSPLPPLRLVMLDVCGNRVQYPHDLRGLEVACRCRSVSGGSTSTAGAAVDAEVSDAFSVRPLATLQGACSGGLDPRLRLGASGAAPGANAAATVAAAGGFGWSDLGTLVLPAGWGVLNVSSKLLLPPAAAATAGGCARTAGGGAAASIEARLSTAPPTCGPADFQAPTACLWQHSIAVTASSAPAAIDLGRACSRGPALEAQGRGADTAGATALVALIGPRWSWLSSARAGRDRDATAATATPPPAAQEGCDVAVLAGCAGSTVTGWVARVSDEAGSAWHAPGSGWRLALYTHAAGSADGDREVVAVLPLPSRVPLEVPGA